MRVLLVSGIWPPDVGGPASHAPALAAFLSSRGHEVEVVVTASRAPDPRPYPVHWARRSLPPGARHAAAAALVARQARGADVVYATSMLRRAAIGSVLARAPLVVKVATDEAYERSRRMGLFQGSLDEFQAADVGRRGELVRRTRTAALRRARHVFFPSRYLHDIALGWGLDPARLSVLPNPAPPLPALEAREAARARLGMDGPTLVLAGRLTPQKAVPVALAAIEQVPGVTLLVVGDGPERPVLEREAAARGLSGRVLFTGGRSRDEVLDLFHAADAALLTSAWENFPHTVVEALATGTPVVSTDVGGVAEVLHDGANGLLVPPGDPDAVAVAIRRFLGDDALRARLRAAAAPSVADLAADRLYARIEDVLHEAARG